MSLSSIMQQASIGQDYNTQETRVGTVTRVYTDSIGNVTSADVRLPGQTRSVISVPNSTGIKLAVGSQANVNFNRGQRHSYNIIAAGNTQTAVTASADAATLASASGIPASSNDLVGAPVLLQAPSDSAPNGYVATAGTNVTLTSVDPVISASGTETSAGEFTIAVTIPQYTTLPNPATTLLPDGTLAFLVDSYGNILGFYELSRSLDLWQRIGGGTVTSVAMTVPSTFSISGSPITSSGTLALSFVTQTANTLLAGPSSGSSAIPTWRTLVPADLPVATTSALGAVKPDGTTITISGGVISSTGGGSTASSPFYTLSMLWDTLSRVPVDSDFTGAGVITSAYYAAGSDGSLLFQTPGYDIACKFDIGLTNTTGSSVMVNWNMPGVDNYASVSWNGTLLASWSGVLTMQSGTFSIAAGQSAILELMFCNNASGSDYDPSNQGVFWFIMDALTIPGVEWYALSSTGSGPAGVMSVGLSLPSLFNVTGSPVTSTGTLTASLVNQSANTFLRGPSSGSAAVPTFGGLVPADLPVATTSAIGAVKPDGSTIVISGSTISAVGVSGGGITALTGDVTASGTGSVAATLATVNSSPGSVGSASNTLTATVNAKGLITALAQTAISITSSAISNFATAVNSLISAASIALSQLAQGGATTGQILEWNGSAWTPTAIGSLPISGTAGGDLSGSYPNPTVQKLNGVNLDTAGLTIGQTLIYLGGGTGWASKDPATFSVSNVFTSSTTIVSGINIYTGTAAATATVNYATSNVRILIKNYSAQPLTVQPYSGQTIDGTTSYLLSAQYSWVEMLFNPSISDWVIINASALNLGGVTSVGLSLPASTFTVSGSPVTANGTLSASLNAQSPNTFFRGPASGSATTPFWASITYADLPQGLPSNKRITTIVSSATPSYNMSTSDQLNITALATGITSMTSGMTGTMTDGQEYTYRITDNGTARAITWGSGFINGSIATLPTTTIAAKTLMVRTIYDAARSAQVCLAVDPGY